MAFGGKNKQNLMFPSPATREVAPKPSSPIAISTSSIALPQLPPTREIWKMTPDEPRQFKDASSRACENGTSDKPVNNRRLGQLPLKVPQIKGQKAEDPPCHISMFGTQRCSTIDHPHVAAESGQSETDPLIPIFLGQHQCRVLRDLNFVRQFCPY